MARESKRRRDDRRFGRAERLADRIFTDLTPGAPAWIPLPPSAALEWSRGAIEAYRAVVATARLFAMDNVAAYYYSSCEKSTWDVTTDFPNCRPPFDRMFLETRRPAVFRDESGVIPFDPSFPAAWGVVVETISPRELPLSTGIPSVDEHLSPMLNLPGVDQILRFSVIVDQRGLILPTPGHYFVPIDPSGRIVGKDKFLMSCHADGDQSAAFDAAESQAQLIHTALLAISFMNCKNVALPAVEPDAALNRERKKAGLRPFVRYHTIDIEPMKRVLRTEGQSESVGLKKALHICRGHFSTYSEEKPLFGKVAGTFWVPSHVRGSAKQGVVISDYNVKAPRVSG